MTNVIISKIAKAIRHTKFENHVYVAGGYVRDLVMRIPSKDIDLTVEVENGGIELANYLYAQHISSKPVVFERFGTASVVIDGEQVEMVQTRKEFYSEESRNPVVEFGTIEDDVTRRDFTINALLLNINDLQIIDKVGGIEDIKNGIIRTTNAPDLIFSEDPLRMLRAIRFAAKYGFKIEKKTLSAIKKMHHRIIIISKERIRDEFNKIITSSNYKLGLDLLIDTKLINYILPELSKTKKMSQPKKYHTKDVYGHTIDVMKNVPNTVEHRLAALLHDIGKVKTFTINEAGEIHFYGHAEVSTKIANKFMSQYRYSNDQLDIVTNAIYHHMSWHQERLNDKLIRRAYLNMGYEKLIFALNLGRADINNHKNKTRVKMLEEMIRIAEEFHLQQKNKIEFPFNGHDVMSMFNVKGPRVGAILDAAKNIYLDDMTKSKDEIFKIVVDNFNDLIKM